MKAKIAPIVKAICKKYDVQGTLAVDHHSMLVLNIKSASIDFLKSYNRVMDCNPQFARDQELEKLNPRTHLGINPHWYHEHFDGKALEFLKEVVPALQGPEYFDHTDISSDYFSCSHYISVAIGKWNKPFIYTGK
jgi:hypothetical protein